MKRACPASPGSNPRDARVSILQNVLLSGSCRFTYSPTSIESRTIGYLKRFSMSKNDQLPAVTHNQNAGKSAGPSDSSETRFNALKHGLTSEGICEVDDQRSYMALHRQLKREYQPCGAVERFFVQRIALGIVRVKRAAKLEADALREIHPPSHKPSLEDLQLRELMDSGRVLFDPVLSAKLGSDIIEILCDRYGRYETANENRLYRALAQLERLQLARKCVISAPIGGTSRVSNEAAKL
jgi:hypothetical protein